MDFVPWTLAINLNSHTKKSRDKIIFKMMKNRLRLEMVFIFQINYLCTKKSKIYKTL